MPYPRLLLGAPVFWVQWQTGDERKTAAKNSKKRKKPKQNTLFRVQRYTITHLHAANNFEHVVGAIRLDIQWETQQNKGFLRKGFLRKGFFAQGFLETLAPLILPKKKPLRKKSSPFEKMPPKRTATAHAEQSESKKCKVTKEDVEKIQNLKKLGEYDLRDFLEANFSLVELLKDITIPDASEKKKSKQVRRLTKADEEGILYFFSIL